MNIEFVWKEYQAAIRAFLHSRVSDADDVDDLLQDILIKPTKTCMRLKSRTVLSLGFSRFQVMPSLIFIGVKQKHVD